MKQKVLTYETKITDVLTKITDVQCFILECDSKTVTTQYFNMLLMNFIKWQVLYTMIHSRKNSRSEY